VIGTEEATLLESGGSAVVGTVDAARRPEATRAWGIEVRGDRLRVLIPATSDRSVANLRGGGAVAVTVTEVATLRSVQVKGRAVQVEDATEADRARSERYREAFFDAVHRTDGSDPVRLARMLPAALVAVECTIEAAFDQTPGPDAGRRL
jgi:hypothetical protein